MQKKIGVQGSSDLPKVTQLVKLEWSPSTVSFSQQCRHLGCRHWGWDSHHCFPGMAQGGAVCPLTLGSLRSPDILDKVLRSLKEGGW